MKNNRQKFLLVAMLLSLIGSQGFVVVKAQNNKNANAAAQGTDDKTGPDRTNPQPQASTSATVDKQGSTGEGEKAGSSKKGDNGKLKGRDSMQGGTSASGGTVVTAPRTSPAPASTPTGTPDVRDANKDLHRLDERVARIEKQLEPTPSLLTDWMPDWLKWGLIALATILILAGIVLAYGFIRNNRAREREKIAANFSGLSKQQKAFSERIRQLEEVSKNLSQQIAQQKSELSGLQQMSRKAPYAPPPPPMSNYSQPVEVSQFPVMVDDYLARVKSRAIPVKYDYKERMLVEDKENEGNLLVVRDDSEENALYLVPSFGFFQKKSDYTTYFENYYACARPVSGSIWIRQPAMVNRVNGGWQLEQLGELEVR
jgi:hypothetical protein